MKNVEIFTSNSAYENGVCIGGYHEIHKINYLQNVQHLIATVESIVKTNLLYGCDDTILEDVTILVMIKKWLMKLTNILMVCVVR